MYGMIVWFDKDARRLANSGITELIEAGFGEGWRWPDKDLLFATPGCHKMGPEGLSCIGEDPVIDHEEGVLFLLGTFEEVQAFKLGFKCGIRSERSHSYRGSYAAFPN